MKKRNSDTNAESHELKQATLQKELLERLMQTSTALLSGHSRKEVLQIILQGVQESGFDRVRIFLLSSDGQSLVGVAQVGMDEERFAGISWPAAGDYRFQVAKQQQSPRIFFPDLNHPDPVEKEFDKTDVAEWVIVPLVLCGEVIGHLAADNKFSRRKINEDELKPLALFAMQAAAAIENADLAMRDEKKLELFAKLALATTDIVGQIGKLDLHELLTLVARYTCEILAAEVCAVFLCKGEDCLSLEAGYGHRESSFRHGLELHICSAEKSGFTGHVAYEGKLVNLHGEAVRNHPAIRTHENTFLPSSSCYSVLALPLKQRDNHQEKLVGLLRADNKKGENGLAQPNLAFTQEDEWILRIFAEVIVVCLENAKLVEHKKLLIKNLPQAVIAIDDKGNVTEFNHEAERILGYKAGEVLDKKVSFLYDNPEEPRHVGISLNQSVTEKLSGYPTLIRTKSGQSIPINLSAYWLHDHEQRSGSVGIFEDLHKLNDYKQQLELTLHAIRMLAEADNLKTGLQRLAELLVVRFPGTFCGVLLFNESETCLVEQAAAYGQEQPNSPVPQPNVPRQISVNDFPGLAQLLQSGRPFRLRTSGGPLTSANMQKLNEEYGFDPPIQSLMVLPIKLGNRVLGVLDLAEMCAEQSQFSNQHQENLELAAAIATQSAIFIDRMLTAERGRTQLLSFYEVSSRLIAQRNPDTLPYEIVEVTAKAAGAVNVDLVLIDEQGRPETAITFPTHYTNRKMEIRPEGVSMRVFRSGISAQFPNTDDVRDRLNPELVSFAEAAICLPLSLPYKRIGVMWLHYAKPRHFSEQEVFALQLYVNQAAIAVENAQEENRQKRLRQTVDAITSKTDFDEVRRQILAGARNLLKADGVIFGFFDHRSKIFVNQLAEADGIDKQIWEQYRDRNPSEHVTAQRLLESGPFFIDNVAALRENEIFDSYTLELLKQIGVKSFLAVPLKVGEEYLGLVCAFHQQPRSFTEKEQRTAISFARYAALGLKNAKLFEQVKKTNEAATAVAKTTVLGDRQPTLDAIVEEISKVTECDAVVLFEYDQEKKQMLKPSVSGLFYPEHALSHDEEKDYPLVYELLSSKKPFQIVQIAESSDYKNVRFAVEEQITTFVAFPLQTAGKRVGVLFVNFRTQRQFTAEELETMQLLANLAALAVHYAQSTEANERKLRELEALQRLSDQLRQAQNLQEMIGCTVALAAKELGTDYCNLILPDCNNQLYLRAQFGWPQELELFFLKPGKGSQAGFTIQTGGPILVDDYATESRFAINEHLKNYKVKSGMSVPMFRDKQIVGALLVFTLGPRRFTEEEVRFFGLIANHAAMAMRGMERYEDLQRRDKHLGAVHNSSQAILTSFGDEQKVLDQIVEEAVRSTGISQPKAVYSTLQLYEADSNQLVIRSFYPPESRSLLDERVENGRWFLDPEKALEGKIGVTGRTVKEGRSQLVNDLILDPDYIRYNPSSKSELSVPLWLKGKIIGTINVESDQLHGFDKNDQEALEALADHAVIAMQIAQTHKTLRETKGLVGTRTALAWMGLANNAWRHTIAGDAAELANRITLIREFLKQDEITNEDIHRHLAQIERLAKSIQERPVTPPLSSEEGVAPTNLTKLVTERLHQLRQNDRYNGIKLVANVQPGTPLLVSVSSEWLRRALDILIDNGVRAVRSLTPSDSARCVVTVSTALSEQKVELRVTDRGPGIPDEIQSKLFTGKIESSRGQGVGLLIAQAIVETYGGKIEVAKTDSEGTEMLIWLSHQL